MGARIRAYDWTRTPLGPPEDWPHGLKTAVRIMLTSRQAMWIGWGPELTYLYNDAYKPIIGGKHPDALGLPTATVWREIWNDISPLLDTALQGDQGTYVESALLIMERNGYPEETYYTFSYSPIPNDKGGTGGIFCANTDDTERVVRERQTALLRQLAAATADTRTVADACARSAEALQSSPRDVPFALIYLPGSAPQTLELAASAGFRADLHPPPPIIRRSDADGWPVALALDTNQATAFFSNVSHEFRTPLTLMLGPIDELRLAAESPDVRAQATLVHRNALRLLRLVNTLLDFSRIEAGRTQANYEATDLAGYTAELA